MEALKRLILALLIGGSAFLIVYPAGRLMLRTLIAPAGRVGAENYIEFITESDLLITLWHSIYVALGTTILALILGLPMAWVVSRTNIPCKGLIRNLTVLTLASPSFLGALAWILLLGPRAGRLNLLFQELFNLEAPPFNIFSPEGMIFVLALFSYPLVFFAVSSALDNMDANLEDCARILGAGRVRTALTITLPAVLPAILAGAILVFVEALVIFGPPAVLGMPVGYYTLATKMYVVLQKIPPRVELSAVMAVPIIMTLAGLLILQRLYLGRRQYTILSGRAAPQRVELHFWRYPLALFCLLVVALSIFVPFGTLFMVSLQKTFANPIGPENFAALANYRYLFQQSAVPRALSHSFILASGAVLIALALSVISSWVVERSKMRGVELLSLMMMSPLAFPGAALGVGLILAFAASPFNLSGTLAIILLAYVIRSLPLTFSYARASLKQVHPEMEEASRILGGGWLKSLYHITAPLMKGGLLAAGALTFVLLFRELGSSIFLYKGGNEVVAVVLYDLAMEANFALMSALSMVIAAVNLGVVLTARRFIGRGPLQV